MSTCPNPSTPDPSEQDQPVAKGSRRKRGDGTAARDRAFKAHRRRRGHLIVRFQHAMLDAMLERSEMFVPDIADEFETPMGTPRAFIGTAVIDLFHAKMIDPLPEVRAARQGGRHGNFYRVWRLAPGVDGSRVAEWKTANPVPPPPEPAESEGAAL